MHAFPRKHAYQTKQTQVHKTLSQCLNSNDFDSDHGTEETIKTFPTMLKLVVGTLVGSVIYSDVYDDSDNEEETSSTSSFKDYDRTKKQRKIPSLLQIA